MGIISICLSSASIFTQLYKITKNRNTSSYSIVAYSIYPIISVLDIIYTFCFCVNSLQIAPTDITIYNIFFANLIIRIYMTCIALIFDLIVFSCKMINHHRAKKANIKEINLPKPNYSKSKVIFLWLVKVLPMVFASIIISLCFAFFIDIKIDPTASPWVWLLVVDIILAVIGVIPIILQFIRVVKTKDTWTLAAFWVFELPINCTFFFFCNLFLALSTKPFNYVLLAELICNSIIPATGIAIIKLKNIFGAKKLGITEKEYILKKYKNKKEAKQK